MKTNHSDVRSPRPIIGIARHAQRALRAIPAMALGLSLGVAHAQAPFPTEQPIKLVVPFAPGGNTDILARVLSVGMAKQLGQSVVAENRAGAGGRIGEGAVAASAPNGYTMLLSGLSSHVLIKGTPPALTFDPQTALIPITLTTRIPLVIVVPASLGANDLRSVVALFKANPEKYAYGSAGTGTSNHLGPNVLFRQAGVDALHVPFKGNGPLVIELLAGRIHIAMLSPATVAQHVRSGVLKVVAVMEQKRLKDYPDAPTIAEAGFPKMDEYDLGVWNGVFVPAKTPPAVVNALYNALRATLNDPESAATLQKIGYSTLVMTQSQAQQYVDKQFELWMPVMKALNLKE